MIIFRRNTEIVFLFFAQNVDCGYTLEPPQCFIAKIEKYVYPCKSQFYYIKVYTLHGHVILMFLFLRSYKCIIYDSDQPVYLFSLLSAPCRLETFSHVSSCW